MPDIEHIAGHYGAKEPTPENYTGLAHSAIPLRVSGPSVEQTNAAVRQLGRDLAPIIDANPDATWLGGLEAVQCLLANLTTALSTLSDSEVAALAEAVPQAQDELRRLYANA